MCVLLNVLLPCALAAADTFPSDKANYLCGRATRPRLTIHYSDNPSDETPRGAYAVPCAHDRAADAWDFAFADEFVITAWWPPSVGQLELYKSAHFNLLLTDNIASSCGTQQTYNDALECIADFASSAARLELQLIFTVGAVNLSDATLAFGEPKTLGDGILTNRIVNLSTSTTYGGGGTGGPFGVGVGGNAGMWNRHYLTVPELAWVVAQLKSRNVSDAFAAVFLHDDDAFVNEDSAALARWLATHAEKKLVPLSNTFADSGPSSLMQSKQFVFMPEEYSVNGKNVPNRNASQMAINQLVAYANNARLTSRFRLDAWPIGNVFNLSSLSLTRIQLWGALAFGARGFVWNPFGIGLVNLPRGWPQENTTANGTTVIFETVKATNAAAAAFGGAMIRAKARFVGTIISPHGTFAPPPALLHAQLPSTLLIVRAINSPSLLLGVFTVDASRTFLVAVDLRVALGGDEGGAAFAPRNVTLTLHPAVGRAIVRSVHSPHDAGVAFNQSTEGEALRIRIDDLEAGSAAFIELHAAATTTTSTSAIFLDATLATRTWWAGSSRSHLSLAHTYPMTAPKPASYDWFAAGSRRFNAMGVFAFDGAGSPIPDSQFIIGASVHAPPLNVASGALWATLRDAGLNVVAVDGETSTAAITAALGFAHDFGMFVMSGISTAVLAEDGGRSVMRNFSCHPSWIGSVLVRAMEDGDASTARAVAAATRMMLHNDLYWAFATATTMSVNGTLDLASTAGVVLPSPILPTIGSAATADAMRDSILKDLYHLQASPAVGEGIGGADAPFTPLATLGVALDACALNRSDSLLRFGAFASLVFGAQSIWWSHLSSCAPPVPTSTAFRVISSANNRVGQWGSALLRSSYKITRLHSSVEGAPSWTARGFAAEPSLVALPLPTKLLVAQLRHRTNPFAPPMLLVVDARVSESFGGAPLRTIRIALHSSVVATQPLEGDVWEGHGVCDKIHLGPVLPLKLPGGSAQLVALSQR